MGIFDAAENYFVTTKWVKRKARSKLNRESFVKEVQDDPITKTCLYCVAVNDCIFVNDIEKMPRLYADENLGPGQLHKNCKCRLLSVNEFSPADVILDFPMKKITEYAFVEKDKKILFEKYMGYTLAEAQELYDIIKAQSIENYGNGNYVIGELNKYGQRISIPCTIRSKGRTPEKEYYFYTGWMVFPNGKIKNNTPFGGFIK